MDIQITLNKIKELFDAVPPVAAPSPDASQVADYILEDGTKISCDKLEIGGNVTLNGTPIADGEHKMQDGTIVETAGGVITELTAPGEPSDDTAVTSDMTSKFEAIEGRFTSYEAKFEAYESRFKLAEDTIVKQQSAIGQLLEVVEKLAAIPVSEPVSSQNQFTNQKSEAKEERFQSILNAIKDIKK